MTAQDVGNGAADRSPEEMVLSRLYRGAGKEQPSDAVDARIRAAAHEALGEARGNRKRWIVPFAVAATIVLSVSIVLQMSQQGVIEQDTIPTVLTERSRAPTAEGAPPVASEAAPATPEVDQLARREVAERKFMKSAPSELLDESRSDRTAELRAKRGEPLKPDKRAAVSGAVALAEKVAIGADVTKVRVSGSPGGYYFSVMIRSPDKGCGQYADWWEVLGVDGALLYRRVLLHSHTDEQPFERSGGPVPIQPDTNVWVRAHMNTGGYGGASMKGTVKSGFVAAVPPAGFGTEAEKRPPLPDGCAF